jgi:uncharacterized protein YbjQ (UPF0145 family)
MPDREPEIANLREIVLSDLQSTDDGARAAFRQEFGGELSTFAESTTTALDLWSHFRETLRDDDERRLTVAAAAFTALNQNISSYKLFMSGYTVASGSLFRQVLEGVSLAFLCSAKSLTVLDRFIENKYSTKNAVSELAKHAQKVHANSVAMQTLRRAYEFYHKYAHLTRLTIAAGANFSLGGTPNVGAYFDPAKLPEYRKEVKGRVSFAKILPNIITGVARKRRSVVTNEANRKPPSTAELGY